MSDITFGLRMTASDGGFTGVVRAAADQTASLSQNAQMAKASVAGLAEGTDTLSAHLQRVVDQADPLQARLRQLQSVFKQLNDEVTAGAGAGQESAIDATYRRLNDEIAKTKGLMAQAGVAQGFTEAASAADKSAFATAGARRELIVLGHEAITGNFSRMPGSFLVLAERIGASGLALTSFIGIVGGAAAVIGTLVLAFVKGHEEAAAMNAAILSSGNATGVTRGQMLELANQLSDTGRIGVQAAKDLVTQFVASGKFGADSLREVAGIAADYAAATNQDVSKVQGELVKLFADPAKGARELTESMGLLSGAQVEYIRHLQAIGQEEQARLTLADALKTRLADQRQELGLLETAWNGLKNAAGSAWDAMLNIGRGDTLEQRIAEQAKAVAAIQQQLDAGGVNTRANQVRLAAAQDLLNLLQSQKTAQDQIAGATAQTTQANKDSLRVQELLNQGQAAQVLHLREQIELLKSAPQTPEVINRIAEINKQITSLLNKGSGQNAVTSALAAMDREVVKSQVSLDNFGKTLDERTTPAERRLQELIKGQPELWAKFTQAQKDHAIASTAAAAANERLFAQWAAGKAIADGFFGSMAKTTDSLQLQAAKLDAEIASYQEFGNAQTGAARAAVEFQIANDKNYAALQALALAGSGWAQIQLAIAEATNDAARAAADDVDAKKREVDAYKALAKTVKDLEEERAKHLQSLEKEIEKVNEEAETVGLSKEQLDQYKVAQIDAAIAAEERALAVAGTIEGDGRSAVEIQAVIDKLKTLRGAYTNLYDKQAAADFQKGIDRTFGQIQDGLTEAVLDGINNGGDAALKDLKRMFDQLVLRPIIQAVMAPIAGQITQFLTGGAPSGSALAGAWNNPLFNLFSGNSGGNFLTRGVNSFVTSGVGSALGLSSPVANAAAGSAESSLFGIPAQEASNVATAAGSFLTTAASFLPILSLAVPFLSGLFTSKPSPAKGQFEISPGTTGFEDNTFVTSRFGNLGFNDANTQQFSGDAAKAFDQLVGGAIDAFASRFSKQQSDHFAEVLKTMTFDTFEGTFTTEDFLQKYGGQVLQQVVTAAFEVLNPALASVVANFKGTADEVAKFANSLLAINDATSKIGNNDFTASVDAALAGADQATADKVLAFVTIAQSFGNSIAGLGPKLEALDAGNITAFVDALGGAQNALAEMAYINDNFTTSAEKATATQDQLASDFAALGLAVPKDHAAFLALLNSIDLTTESGRTLYAAIAALAPEFVAVAGTADQAAQALKQQAQAGLDYYNQHFLTPDQQTAQRVGVDETALFDATKEGTKLNAVLRDMGLNVIPTTRQGVQDLVNAVKAKYGADSDEYQALLAIIPVIGDLNDATNSWGDAVTAASDAAVAAASDIQRAFNQIDDQLGQFTTNLGNLGQLAGEAKDFGTQLSDAVLLYGDTVTKLQAKIADAKANPTAFNQSQLQYVYLPELTAAQKALAGAQSQLAEFTDLSAQFGADKAAQLVQLEDQYAKEKQLYAGNAAALAILSDNFQASWNDIVNATQAAVTAVQQSIEDFIKSIDQTAQATQGTAGQRFGIELALGTAKQNALAAELPTASATAAPGIQTDLNKITAYNETLAGYIADFTIYTAEYGTDVASQLTDLEKWRDDQKAILTGMLVDDPTQLSIALGILGNEFDDKWKAIIDGISNGVDGSLSELDRLRQGVADYLKGLQIGDLSPLSPRQQLDQAQEAYIEELIKAQAGDLNALGDITQFADAYLKQAQSFFSAPSSDYRDIFTEVSGQLGDIAGSLPNGLPTATTSGDVAGAAIAAVIPQNGRMASNTDIEGLKALLQQLITDQTAANASDIQQQTEAITATQSTAQTVPLQ